MVICNLDTISNQFIKMSEFCNSQREKPFYCELPDDFNKQKKFELYPQNYTYASSTSISYSGTAQTTTTTTTS